MIKKYRKVRHYETSETFFDRMSYRSLGFRASQKVRQKGRFLFILCLLFGASESRAMVEGIVVSAGANDRRDAVVEVTFAQPPGEDRLELVDDAGGITPLQMRDERHGVFIVPELKAHATRSYVLRPGAKDGLPLSGVTATKADGTIVVKVDAKTAFTYQGAKTEPPAGYGPAYKRGGYIYPVLTPSGRNVTDDYPANHKHHHGIWSPWTKTEFEGRHPDFWNMGDKTGTVEPVDFGSEFSGPVCGGFTAHHRMVDLSAKPEPKDALNETWDVVAYCVGGRYFVFDLAITQTCASACPLTLEKYRYGGLGFRGAHAWDGKDACEVLTSEGKTRANGNESRGKWVRYSGTLEGQPASVAILNPLDDFRFPQPMRIFPDQPFFCYAPEQLGEFQIVPGKPFVERYRFVVADGVLDADELNRMWEDYAHPPKAEVK
jgi:hypothetical protein